MHLHSYERSWFLFSVGLVLVFFLAIFTAAVAGGIQVPSPVGQVDPANLAATDFAQPGLRELAPGHYELYIRAKMWQWAMNTGENPRETHIPAGAKLTIFVTSEDVQHGFKLVGPLTVTGAEGDQELFENAARVTNTNINGMIIPGQITKFEKTFSKPGVYLIVCHEYCGAGHQVMSGKIIVE